MVAVVPLRSGAPDTGGVALLRRYGGIDPDLQVRIPARSGQRFR
jgi:hypothetical protein